MRYRLDGSVIASIAIHAVIAAVVLPAIIAPHRIAWVFAARADAASLSERVRYVETAPRRGASPLPDTAPAIPTPPAPAPGRLVAPLAPGIRSAPTMPVPSRGGSVDGATGGGDPRSRTVTLVPRDPDPRVLTRPAAIARPAFDRADAIRSITRSIASLTDSATAVAEAIAASEQRDWSLELGGGRFGIDSAAVHLGRFSIPGLVLGLLPIPGGQVLCLPTGCEMVVLKNPGVSERAARIAEMSAEIRSRASITHDVREEVARIAARRDDERAARPDPRTGSTVPVRATPPPG